MPTLDTVVDEGKTLVAIDDCFAGRIDSYNNVITKFFAWMMGRAMTVTIGGEKVYADINSLKEFMWAHGVYNLDVRELSYRDLNTYNLMVVVLPGKERFMATHIKSQSTKDQLAQKLFFAIWNGNETEACKWIRTGAELNNHAWVNEKTGDFYFKKFFAPSLSHRAIQGTTFTEATPLLLALRLNKIGVANLMYEHGADLTLLGQTCRFSRAIADVQNDINFMPTVRYETVVDAQGNAQTVSHYGVDMYTTQTTYFTDNYEERYQMFYNALTGTLEYRSQENRYIPWDTQHLTGLIPIW